MNKTVDKNGFCCGGAGVGGAGWVCVCVAGGYWACRWSHTLAYMYVTGRIQKSDIEDT